MQTGGPPVLLGSASPKSIERLMDFCDGWYAPDFISDPAFYSRGIASIREWASGEGRQLGDVHLSIQLGVVENAERAKRLLDAGFRHLLFSIMPAQADKTLPILDRYAELATALRKQFGASGS
jgi:hypothetical protein